MKILLLPGMDGTGLLFDPLIQNIPKELDAEVVCLNDIKGASYRQQAEEVSKTIGSSRVVLIAESYSGRIAYELSRILGAQVAKVIFVASFISCPSKFVKFATLLPAGLLKPNLYPNWLLQLLCFSSYGSRENIHLVHKAISKVATSVLKQRLHNIAELEVPKISQSIPAIYIRPTKDHLVNRSAVRILSNIYKQLDLVFVEGGHFIAQIDPESCAKIIYHSIVHAEEK